MNLSRNQRRRLRAADRSGGGIKLDGDYPYSVQLYDSYPDFRVSVDEFEEATAERLAVLQTIDEVNGKNLKTNEWKRAVIQELRSQDLKAFCRLITNKTSDDAFSDLATRRRDHMSHFVLRLAFCQSDEKSQWFVAREVDLFRLRWLYLSSSTKKEFLAANNIGLESVSMEEKLSACESSSGLVEAGREYLKAPFTSVSDLVRTRRVYLRAGVAYVLDDDIISLLVTHFRKTLSRSLAFARRNIHLLDEDNRVLSILRGAGQMQRLVNYVAAEGSHKIDIRNLDAVAEMSFPPCMQKLHQRLRTENHLKHSARRQYCLFLKGIGVAMEDTIRFWKAEFTKKMDPEKFDKSYVYFIRHSYGKEGKRTNYTPMSCLQVINSSVGAGEHHGCPFRHSDAETVRKTLQNNGLPLIGSQEVLELMKNKHYQLACAKYFELKHGATNAAGVNHPNIYFDSSRAILVGKAVKKEEPGKSPD